MPYIKYLEPHQVFVFGTNTEGRHGKGAALTAYGNYPKVKGTIGKWAIYGQSRGFMNGHEGRSFGIITKELRKDRKAIELKIIALQIQQFVMAAKLYCELEYLVTAFGTGLAGFSHEELKTIWDEQDVPDNVKLPTEWL